MADENKKKVENSKNSASKKVDSKKSAETKKTAKPKIESVKEEKGSKQTVAKKTESAKEEKSSKQTVAKKTGEKVVKNNVTSFVKHKEVDKKWLIIDAAGKSLGRVAAVAASLLRGKHKVDFTPNVDCGDAVIVVNCQDVVLTGKKLEQKVRYRHSGWIGGIKEIRYSELMKKSPQMAMAFAIKGMLPKNSLGAKMAKHLRTYKDDVHGQEAQKPQIYKI